MAAPRILSSASELGHVLATRAASSPSGFSMDSASAAFLARISCGTDVVSFMIGNLAVTQPTASIFSSVLGLTGRFIHLHCYSSVSFVHRLFGNLSSRSVRHGIQ